MQTVTFVLLVAVVAMALAEGQFYVPRAYYTIDAEGHASAPVPLRRLRRSLSPYPYMHSGADANANANAEAEADSNGGNSNANANAHAKAHARSGSGGWAVPPLGLGSNLNTLSVGQPYRRSGPVYGARSVSAGSSVDLDSSGVGYYAQYASVD
ncbi:uncharacterized protein LOC113518407 [Galleria mellonella]|uniref:Uncharacterized protein LOC113518407 n=1 Tax=Galleria mellonella TaxID=7137 RepID=A0A6J3CBK7_GALME|nr:uncharacterized protein LOC113518407 [Galleria mellonella]